MEITEWKEQKVKREQVKFQKGEAGFEVVASPCFLFFFSASCAQIRRVDSAPWIPYLYHHDRLHPFSNCKLK